MDMLKKNEGSDDEDEEAQAQGSDYNDDDFTEIPCGACVAINTLDDDEDGQDGFGIESGRSRKQSEKERNASGDFDSDTGYLSRKGSKKETSTSYGAYNDSDDVFLSRKGSKKESITERSTGDMKTSEGLSRAGSRKESVRGGMEGLDLGGLSRKGSKK
jgi:hypothetical protein